MRLRTYVEQLLDLIYPKVCFGCRRPIDYQSNIYLCSECWEELDRQITPPFCTICGRPINISPHENLYFGDISDLGRCPDCIGCCYHFSRGYTAALYERLVKDCIHNFKYNYNTYLAGTLAQLMIKFSLKYIDIRKIDVLVPVPLHWRRFRQRGFNQAQLLAKRISIDLGIPVRKNVLRRIRHIPSQVELPRCERLDNVKGAFKVRNTDGLIDKLVLLIDDVFTTGATLDECSRVIMEAGAKDVWVFSLARGMN